MAYKKKSGYTSKYKTKKGKKAGYKTKSYKHSDDDGVKQSMIYRFPFSKATTVPKIPDGNSKKTVGLQVRTVSTFEDITGLILYPGINSSGCSHKTGNNADVLFTQGRHCTYFCKPLYNDLKDDDTPFELKQGFVKNIGSADTIFETNEWSQWRVVSCGMRIQNTNNDHENDGYWESVRLPINKTNFGRINIVTSDSDNGVIQPKAAILHDLSITNNWQHNSSYQTGQIKDFWKYEARLRPQYKTHDWIPVAQSASFNKKDVTDDNGTKRWLGGEDKPATADLQWLENMVDDNWDMIQINIRGNAQTSIIVSTVINYELVPAQFSGTQRFASECIYSPKLVESKFNQYRTQERFPMAQVINN